MQQRRVFIACATVVLIVGALVSNDRYRLKGRDTQPTASSIEVSAPDNREIIRRRLSGITGRPSIKDLRLLFPRESAESLEMILSEPECGDLWQQALRALVITAQPKDAFRITTEFIETCIEPMAFREQSAQDVDFARRSIVFKPKAALSLAYLPYAVTGEYLKAAITSVGADAVLSDWRGKALFDYWGYEDCKRKLRYFSLMALASYQEQDAEDSLLLFFEERSAETDSEEETLIAMYPEIMAFSDLVKSVSFDAAIERCSQGEHGYRDAILPFLDARLKEYRTKFTK